jgi:hypothetical protein
MGEPNYNFSHMARPGVADSAFSIHHSAFSIQQVLQDAAEIN